MSAKSPASGRLELARRYYREFYASCFWHLRPELEITEENLSLVVRGLRQHGGHRGYRAAAQLLFSEGRDAPCH